MQEFKARISGKVQMVMFRDFAQRKARSLFLTGLVENKDDGSVEVIAQGKKEALEKFIEHLHKGPFMARVMRVDVSWVESTREYRDFKIIY